MLSLYRHIPLPGGVSINIYDHSRIYYGGFYLVKLEISCDIPADGGAVVPETSLTAKNDAKSLPYKRYLQRMGVAAAEVAAVKQALVNDFETNSLPYILSAGFPAKLASSLRATMQKPVHTYQEKTL